MHKLYLMCMHDYMTCWYKRKTIENVRPYICVPKKSAISICRGPKTLFNSDFICLKQFVAVYDFAPSPGKHGRLELAFQAGERINVYGEERPDGFYYGEVG